jgi:hypothetical protein
MSISTQPVEEEDELDSEQEDYDDTGLQGLLNRFLEQGNLMVIGKIILYGPKI